MRNIVLPWETEKLKTPIKSNNSEFVNKLEEFSPPPWVGRTPEPPKPHIEDSAKEYSAKEDSANLISDIAKTVVDLKMMSPDIKLFNSPTYNSITVSNIEALIKAE